ARRARLELQERAATGRVDPDARRALAALFIDFEQPVALRSRALWGLHLTGGFECDVLQRALSDTAEYVRGWAVQLLTEGGDPGPEVVALFARLAYADPSPVVRKYLAAALQRLEPASRREVARGLLTRAEDAEDPNIPRLVWYGVEPL